MIQVSRVYKYLEKLEKDKQLLVDTLNSKDITSSSEETFSTLVPKVNSMDDLNKYYDLTKKTSGDFKTLIINIPILDTSEYTSMISMFSGLPSLTTIPLLDTSKVTNMNSMFNGCKSLKTIPLLDTSNVTIMQSMFNECKTLTSIPQLNTSKVTNMRQMFQWCESITTIPQLDTSNVTNMQDTFRVCKALTEIPQLDTSKVTDMNGTFQACESITTIPQLDTSNVTTMGSAFRDCTLLTTIPQLDASKVTSVYYIFNNSSSLITLGGLKDLGKAYLTTQSANYYNYKLDLYNNKLTHDSLMNVINNLYDIASIGVQPQQLKLGNTNKAKLTEDEIAIATNKGWTVS